MVGGKTRMTGPAYSFLIEHSTGQKVLFDLSTRKDWENLSPMIIDRVKGGNWKVVRGRSVVEILEENGIKGGDIDAIIWSHMHWDQ
jgi:glyoxylase-like metal-dependent hydrolase (beta-lactamase superfamily II)